MDENLNNHEEDIKIIKEQVKSLFSIYSFYKYIFKKENEEVLYNFPIFFARIQILMLDYLTLGISRLLDPYKQGRNKNLTLETLIEKLTNDEFDNKAQKCILEDLRKEANILRKKRNKYLAHLDYKEAKKRYKEEKSIIHILELENTIEGILKEISKLLNYILDIEITYRVIEQQVKTEIDYLFYILRNEKILEGLEFLCEQLSLDEKKELANKYKQLLDSHSPNLKEREQYRNLVNFIFKKET